MMSPQFTVPAHYRINLTVVSEAWRIQYKALRRSQWWSSDSVMSPLL